METKDRTNVNRKTDYHDQGAKAYSFSIKDLTKAVWSCSPLRFSAMEDIKKSFVLIMEIPGILPFYQNSTINDKRNNNILITFCVFP